MRIMALDAVHFSFEHGMVLGEVEFGLGIQMALQAGLGFLAGVDDEFLATRLAAPGDMFAARAMAGFAAVLAGHPSLFRMQTRVRTGGKNVGDIIVAIGAGLVPDVGRPRDSQREDDGAIRRRTGTHFEQQP